MSADFKSEEIFKIGWFVQKLRKSLGDFFIKMTKISQKIQRNFLNEQNDFKNFSGFKVSGPSFRIIRYLVT